MAVAVVERFEQKPLYAWTVRQDKKVAVVERRPLMEVRVHNSQLNTG